MTQPRSHQQVIVTHPTQQELYDRALAAIKALKPDGIGCRNDLANDHWEELEFYLAVFPPTKSAPPTRLERELAEARAQVLDWENREAAICPEDVGFEELLHVLQSKLAALTKPVSAVEFKQFAHPDDWGVDCTYINACNELIAARAQSTRRKTERRKEER